jgi:hypothetical protein
MNWWLISIAAAGIAAVALRRYRPWLEQMLKPASEAAPRQPALRKVTALDRLIDALRHERDPLERHRLLGEIVDESYRQRTNAAMNKVFLRFAGMHVKELPKMAEAVKAAHGGKLPPVLAFKLLAAALEKAGRLEEALSVCRQAGDLGLIDGTKAGFAGRIKKLEKKIKDVHPAIKRPGRGRARARSEQKS